MIEAFNALGASIAAQLPYIGTRIVGAIIFTILCVGIGTVVRWVFDA